MREVCDELYRLQSEEAHRSVLRYFSNACRDDATFANCLGTFILQGYYRRFFEPIKQRWVEHPDLLSYITCDEPFQGLRTTPAIAGLRIKLEPKSKGTYRQLERVLREERGLDLEKEIAEEERRANDRLALGTVGQNGEFGNGRRRVGNTGATAEGGSTRSYVIRRLDREANADPPDLQARMLLDKVMAGEVSAHAAAIAMGWRKPPDPYRQLVLWWDKAGEEDRDAFMTYVEAWLAREVA
jgi:hypothetical protein